MKLLQEYNQPHVFAVGEGGIKHWVQNMFTFSKRGFVWGEQVKVSLSEINNYVTGETWNDDPHVETKRAEYFYMPPPGKKYRCRVYLGHEQTIQYRVRTKIELDIPDYDPFKMFDQKSHSIVIPESADYLIIPECWYDLGAKDGGVYSVIVAKNDKHLSKDCLIERDDMCADDKQKDIQPHAADVVALKKGDRISLWTVFYHGGPCKLKVAHTQNYLTIKKW